MTRALNLMFKFVKNRREKTRRIHACLAKLHDWSIEDLEDVNMRIGKLCLIAPDNIEIVNLTWVEVPIEFPKVFEAQNTGVIK